MNNSCVLDYETRSRVDLKRYGLPRYAADPSTGIRCCAYKTGDEPIQLWAEGSAAPEPLVAAFQDAGCRLIAHNAGFEIAMSETTHGLPRVSLSRWFDTAAQARHANLPGALADVALRLKLHQQKDAEGKKVMLSLSKPQPDGTYDNDPKKLDILYRYCEQDVATEAELATKLPHWPESEQEIWRVNHRVNQIGIPLDVPLCRGAVQILDEAYGDVEKQITELTGGEITAGTQVQRILRYVNERGVNIDTLSAPVIADVLCDDSINSDARKALELRQASANAACRKYSAFLDRVSQDGRLRDQFMYCGAQQTGRFSSSGGAQVQNLARGVMDDTTAEIIYTADHEKLREYARGKGTSVVGLLSQGVRGALLPSPGKIFVRMDLSQIELRLAHWLAGNKDFLDKIDAGLDPYIDFAAGLHTTNYDNVSGRQRQEAKPICLAEGTEVLTDRGWVKIEAVRQTDKVWDGVEWVSNDGVVKRWDVEVIKLGNIRITPDHLVWTGKDWRTASTLAAHDDMLYQSRVTAAGLSPCSGTSSARVEGSGSTLCNAVVGAGRTLWRRTIGIRKKWFRATDAVLGGLRDTLNGIRDTTTCARTTKLERVFSRAYPRSCRGAITPRIEGTPGMGAGVLKFTNRGGVFPKAGESFWDTCLHFRDTITSGWKSIVSTLIKDTNRKIFDSSRVKKMQKILERWTRYRQRFGNWKRRTQNFANVFDLLNCGPRNRFMVRDGGHVLMVHNCLGGVYGLGVNRLTEYAKTYGVDMDAARSQEIVQHYRKTNSKIVSLWGVLDRSFQLAHHTGKKVKLSNGLLVDPQPGCTVLTLPSGRDLRYWEAVYEHTKKGPSFRFKRADGSPVRMWGGHFLENICQALCRDLLCHGMLCLERAGFTVVFHAHDEVLIETDLDNKDEALIEAKRAFLTPTDWATFTVDSDGGFMTRYKKG